MVGAAGGSIVSSDKESLLTRQKLSDVKTSYNNKKAVFNKSGAPEENFTVPYQHQY